MKNYLSTYHWAEQDPLLCGSTLAYFVTDRIVIFVPSVVRDLAENMIEKDAERLLSYGAHGDDEHGNRGHDAGCGLRTTSKLNFERMLDTHARGSNWAVCRGTDCRSL